MKKNNFDYKIMRILEHQHDRSLCLREIKNYLERENPNNTFYLLGWKEGREALLRQMDEPKKANP